MSCCCLFLQERKISVTWSRNTVLPRASSQHASPKDQTVFSAIILSTNEPQLKLHSHHHPAAPLLFSADFWLTGTPGQPNTNSFPWWKSVWTVHHSRLLNPQELVQYKNVFFSYTFFLQMSSFRFLLYTRLGNIFSTGVSWHDSPLKLRMNVLHH